MASLLKLVCALGLIVLAKSLTEEDFAFNCHRQNANQCQNKATCDDDGKCVCTNGAKGYDCSVATEGTACDPTCGATNSTCAQDNTCLCKPMLYGSNCEFKSHQVKCADPKELITQIKFPGVEKANIYIEDQPDCKHTSMATNVANFTGVATKIVTDVNQPCHASPTKIDVNGQQKDVDCVTLVVQFNNYVTYYDYKVQFCCVSYGDSNGDTVRITVGQIKPPKAVLGSPNPVKGGPLPGVTSKMTDKGGLLINNDDIVKIGDDVILMFQLPKDDKRLLKIIECELSDMINAASKTLFVQDGCMLKATIATKMDSGSDSGNQSFASVATKAVKFQGEPNVQYICLVRVCKLGEESKCEASTCNTTRRRRDVAQPTSNPNDTVEGQLWQYVRVASPGVIRPTNQNEKCDIEDKKLTFTATVIGFGIITIILLVIVAVLGFCILNRRRRSSGCKD